MTYPFDPVKEVMYVFVKGEGWVPEIVRLNLRQAAKFANFGDAVLYGYNIQWDPGVISYFDLV